MTPEDIRREGLKALAERLGVVGVVIQQFGRGEGDYTKDREKFLGDRSSVDELIEEIKARRIHGC